VHARAGTDLIRSPQAVSRPFVLNAARSLTVDLPDENAVPKVRRSGSLKEISDETAYSGRCGQVIPVDVGT
jgi:hypothetical protein